MARLLPAVAFDSGRLNTAPPKQLLIDDVGRTLGSGKVFDVYGSGHGHGHRPVAKRDRGDIDAGGDCGSGGPWSRALVES